MIAIAPHTKRFLSCTAAGFIFVLIIAEVLAVRIDGPVSTWEIRRQKEQTAVIMHAEDIWRNKRSTFQSFDPTACINEFHSQWHNSWHEVTCIAKDGMGQSWQYIARYGKRSSYFTSGVFFLLDDRPERELTKIEATPSIGSHSK
jgi:hypothetical protein